MKINTKYERVIPRDLFNEAKLLKCVGHLCLMIHDKKTPVEMSMTEPSKFDIGLRDDGFLAVANLEISIKGKPHRFMTIYNSKSPYPLYVEDANHGLYLVFDKDGNFDDEFIKYCTSI